MYMLRFLYLIILIIFLLNVNNLLNFFLLVNVDLISISLLILRLWILILIKLRQINHNYLNSLFFIFLILNLRLIFSFSTNSLLFFYVFFEWSLIPIFFIIIGWGYQLERIKSRIYLLIYTLFASLPLLMIILYLSKINNSMRIIYLPTILFIKINNLSQFFLFLGFLVKFPIFFFHQWLPKAHVEAPVGGSIILAGILLKLGGYGIIRILFLLKTVSVFYFIVLFSLFGGRLLRVVCLINRDIKVLIAYSSVVHISLIISNLFSKNFWRLNGAIIIIVAHGICSSGIFSCANIIYERSHSRIIIINKSNLNYFPIISIFWFLLCIANFGGPFTYNLLGEIILIINLRIFRFSILIFISFISFFSAAYRLVLYSNLQQGLNNNLFFNINNLSTRERITLFSHSWPLLLILFSSILI